MRAPVGSSRTRADAAASGPALKAVGSGRHLVVVPEAASGAGSRAALEALLELTAGAVDLVIGPDAPAVAAAAPDRVEVHRLPTRLTRSMRPSGAAASELGRLLQGADHCSVIAPDVVEGPEGLRAAVRSIAVARAAARHGIDSRVIGFTWALGAGTGAVTAVRGAGRSGVRLFVRDNLSHMRAMNDGIFGLHSAADLGFAATGTAAGVLEEIGAEEPIAVIEVCASISTRADPTVDYLSIAMRLHRRGLHLVLVPSLTSSADDLAVCVRIAEALDHQRVTVLRRLLDARELRALVSAARIGVSDRTRFTVLALSCGTPVVALAAGGEVEDLLRLTGQQWLCVPPRPGFAFAAQRAIDGVLQDEAEVRRRIRSVLPDLVALARVNLTGLPGAERAG